MHYLPTRTLLVIYIFFFGTVIYVRGTQRQRHRVISAVSVQNCDENHRPPPHPQRTPVSSASKTLKVLRIISSGSFLDKAQEKLRVTTAPLCRHDARCHMIRFCHYWLFFLLYYRQILKCNILMLMCSYAAFSGFLKDGGCVARY